MRRKMRRSELEDGVAFLIMRRHKDGSVSNAIAVEEFDHPGTWGIVLADTVQHLVNAYVSMGMDATTTRSEIVSMLMHELTAPSDKAYRVDLED